MPEIIHLPMKHYDTFAFGGAVLSAMMRPDVDPQRRAPTTNAIASYLGWAQVNFGDETQKRAVPKTHLHLDERSAERTVRLHRKALRDRVTAGRMAVPLLMEALWGDAAPRALEAPDNTLNQLAHYVLEDSGMSDAHNLEARVWRKSRSVVHLGAAYAVTVQTWQRLGRIKSPYLAILFGNGFFLADILREAMFFEDLLQRSRLALKPESLIRFRLDS